MVAVIESCPIHPFSLVVVARYSSLAFHGQTCLDCSESDDSRMSVCVFTQNSSPKHGQTLLGVAATRYEYVRRALTDTFPPFSMNQVAKWKRSRVYWIAKEDIILVILKLSNGGPRVLFGGV